MEFNNRMKSKRILAMRITLCSFIVMLVSLSTVYSQEIFVNGNDGLKSSYSLSNIRKLSFTTGNITITQNDKTSTSYALNEIKSMSFQDASTGIEKNICCVNERIRIYPNPVKDVLNIEVSEMSIHEGIFEIYTLEGRVLKTQQTCCNDITSIDVSNLKSGLYICHYSTTTETRTIKLIKQ